MKAEKLQRSAAEAFAKRWEGRGYEKGESQSFWLDLLGNVFGVEKPTEFVVFEEKVRLDNSAFIDVMIPATHVMIEQKSMDKDLREPIRQSDGTRLTPFQQAQRYIGGLPRSQHPKWIVTCNFKEFDVYDMENPNAEPQRILLKDLGREYYRLQFLADEGSEHLQKELEVSMKAGEIVGRIYDAFVKQYDRNDSQSMRYLNILCVRIVFCLYAEDAGIFGKRDQFHDYLEHYPTEDMRNALLRLFDELNTPPEQRSKYDKADLAAFPYTNGGLFAEKIDIPQFTDEIRAVLLLHASLDFDWSQISPTIFGGVFESTLNPETRRKGGMHYTSIENIHKVIDPLFLDSLRREFEEIKEITVVKTRLGKLHAFQDKLASLKFLDPACGSGNFLTEIYLSLRRLENEVIKAIYSVENLPVFENPIKVSIHQFYGIEINDFAVSVATTALWISEAQMMAETEHIIHHDLDFLPLHSYANIREGNALKMEWDVIETEADIPTIHAKNTYWTFENQPDMASEPLVKYGDINLVSSRLYPGPKQPERTQVKFDYIIGNPPFVGASMMTAQQKADAVSVFGKIKLANSIDYVGAWYCRAARLIRGTDTECALVSTSSITQGEQVAPLWKPLIDMGLRINFAYRTFRWDSESSQKAAVHCVVIGFSMHDRKEKYIFGKDGSPTRAAHINPYLYDAPDAFAVSRSKPICNVPKSTMGNKPSDNGNFILTPKQREKILSQTAELKPYIRRYVGARDFLNEDETRYCLWLKDASPALINKNAEVRRRVEAVRQFRLKSTAAPTRKAAETPYRFFSAPQTNEEYVIIPRVSSERRRYVPMGFMSADTIAADSCTIVCGATLYHFGVLTSNIHMAWMRVVGGRLKSDYRYSASVVYNNFPWPQPIAGCGPCGRPPFEERIEKTAQAILDVRAKYLDSTLADLYSPTSMPHDLLEAHRANDRAVMAAYGFSTKMGETECVAKLFEMYANLNN